MKYSLIYNASLLCIGVALSSGAWAQSFEPPSEFTNFSSIPHNQMVIPVKKSVSERLIVNKSGLGVFEGPAQIYESDPVGGPIELVKPQSEASESTVLNAREKVQNQSGAVRDVEAFSNSDLVGRGINSVELSVSTVSEPVAVASLMKIQSQTKEADWDDADSVSVDEDPFEGVNRAVYGFNKGVDTVLVRPLTKLYVAVAPKPIRTGIENLIDYVKTPLYVANYALQGNVKLAGDAMGRMLINTFGFGVLDIASEAKLFARPTNFGDTLGVWGATTGPYIVLPLLGPTTLRGATGLALVDMPLNPVNNWGVASQNTYRVLDVLQIRERFLSKEKLLESVSLDEYLTIRSLVMGGERSKVEMLKEEK